MFEKTMLLLYRGTYVLAGLLIVLAIWVKFIGFFGYTMTLIPYAPGRILELAAVLLLIVMTLLLRQIRDKQS